MGQSESSPSDFDFSDNKNNATVGNYPSSPAIISQPHTYGGGGGGGYPAQQQQDPSYGPYNIPYGQQKDASGFGYNPNQVMQPGQYPMGQYGQGQYPQGQPGTPYPQSGPPPPYSYHQGPPPPGSYFPPQASDYPPYPPNSQMYPQTHNMPDHGKY